MEELGRLVPRAVGRQVAQRATSTSFTRLAVARGGKTTVLECRVCEVSVTSKVLRTLTYHDFCDMGFGTFLESNEIF